MPIEMNCISCEQLLRVDDDFAGQSARCPKCQAVNQVPQAATSHDPDDPPWFLKTPEGQTYGPVASGELENWIREGRVSHQCLLRRESEDDWKNANLIFPAISPQEPVPTAHRTQVAAQVSQSASPASQQHSSAPNSGATENTTFLMPHRGALVLVLGILSWVVTCPLFGVAAWIFGAHDLREMREERMDPSGMNITQGGMMLGMIHTLLSAVVILVSLFVVLLLFAFG